MHNDLSLDKLTLYWATKEAIYKLKEGNTNNFKDDIRIEPFVMKSYGSFFASFQGEAVQLKYLSIGSNKLVYTIS